MQHQVRARHECSACCLPSQGPNTRYIPERAYCQAGINVVPAVFQAANKIHKVPTVYQALL